MCGSFLAGMALPMHVSYAGLSLFIFKAGVIFKVGVILPGQNFPQLQFSV